MGYRSDIALAMTKHAKADFYRNLSSENVSKELREEIESLFSCADQHFTDRDTDAEAWYWSGLKWYPGYPDVDFIESAMSELDDEEFYFVRAGESYDDNDIQGCWLDNPFAITFCRQIVFDC